MWEGGNITTNDRIETNYTNLTINYTLPKCPKTIVKYKNSDDDLKHLHNHKRQIYMRAEIM